MNDTTTNHKTFNDTALGDTGSDDTARTKKTPSQWREEEIITGIKDCAAKLGKIPTLGELKSATGISEKTCIRRFGNYGKALQAAGFEPRGAGFHFPMAVLFTEWASAVRKLGAIPTAYDYGKLCSYSLQPLRQRFRYLNDVPAGMAKYAMENGLAAEWSDVLEIARNFRPRSRGVWGKPGPKQFGSTQQFVKNRPVSGAPLVNAAMMFAPVNEMGVVYLFGTMASRLGFILTYIGTAYPDAQVYREVSPGKWQLERVEFELLSRNFLLHGHDPRECDLIVCWDHNWEECPLEVLELKKAVSNQPLAFRPLTEWLQTKAERTQEEAAREECK